MYPLSHLACFFICLKMRPELSPAMLTFRDYLVNIVKQYCVLEISIEWSSLSKSDTRGQHSGSKSSPLFPFVEKPIFYLANSLKRAI